MDPRVSWIQPEQTGPATDLWMNFWCTVRRLKCLNLNSNQKNCAPMPISQELPEIENNNSSNMKTPNNADFIPLNEGDGLIPPKAQKKHLLPTKPDASQLSVSKKRRENPASIYDLNSYGSAFITKGGTPWKSQSRCYRGAVGLHEEIHDFYMYLRPNQEEEKMREKVVKDIEDVILHEWPCAKVEIFGSFRTGLYLPTSDIDVVVFGNWKTPPLWSLKDILVEKNIADEHSIKVLDRAAVPIVKLRHTQTEVKVDISFNTKNGIQSVELIKSYLEEFPNLAQLVFVLKQFLLQRDLNEVWTGGLSSYALILICISFLQLHGRDDSRSATANVGVLLIEFFELYGRNFNYSRTAIRVRNGGSYVKKEEMCKQMENGTAPSILCVEDPLNIGNDLGRGSYGLIQVRQAFEYAYRMLSKATSTQSRNYTKTNTSILGRIIRITDEVIDYRQLIHDEWSRVADCINQPSLSSSGSGCSSDMAPHTSLSDDNVTSSPSESDNEDTVPCKKHNSLQTTQTTLRETRHSYDAQPWIKTNHEVRSRSNSHTGSPTKTQSHKTATTSKPSQNKIVIKMKNQPNKPRQLYKRSYNNSSNVINKEPNR